ncbi:MAG TPA: hypothetical protein VF115_00590 [Acidimicrobiia bacterium]
MPNPHGRDRLSPDDLARMLASQLASPQPQKTRFSLRDSVLVGRLIAGVIIILMGVGIVGAVLLGVDWWTDRSSAAEVLGSTEITSDTGSSAASETSAAHGSPGSGMDPFVGPGSVGVTPLATSWVFPEMPSPTTTLPVLPDSASTTSRRSTSTTPGTPSTLAPGTTSPAPPTTTAEPVAPTTQTPTTTTVAGATTTGAPTTTTGETTTTCAGNSGGGRGSGPCGP